MSENELEPIRPEEAISLYLRDRQSELAENTIKAYRYKLGKFSEWCEQEGIENLNTLSGRALLRFKQFRQEDLNSVSLKSQLDTLRAFIRWCESIDAVEQDLHNKVLSPSPSQTERQRDELIEPETASEILEYLSRFEYGSLHHALLSVLWRCGVRTGTLRSFDICDYDKENRRIRAIHRPPETPLKNKDRGERLISISKDLNQVISDYVDHSRPSVTDSNGRKPLFATQFGRISRSTIRETCYRWSHPCKYNGGDCPHGREINSCQALGGKGHSPSVCPSSRSPHAWRRGAITHHLTQDVPVEVVSDRMNVSPDVLEQHYDRRSEEVKVEQRREYLSDI